MEVVAGVNNDGTPNGQTKSGEKKKKKKEKNKGHVEMVDTIVEVFAITVKSEKKKKKQQLSMNSTIGVALFVQRSKKNHLNAVVNV